ncbi:MAG: type II secretion system protein GspK [Candidatus Binatia bacterium]|nr:type II secretion system protein GspK [Candidatus Binatia bacterium]
MHPRRHRVNGGVLAKTLRDQQGLALLSALLSVALLTLIVVEMTDATFVHSHLTRNAGNAMAAQLLARSGQVGAHEALGVSDDQVRGFVNTFIDASPLSLPTAQGHMMQIAIRDEVGRLNLNDALDNPEPFENLFADLDLDPSLLQSVQARLEVSEDGNLRSLSGDCSLPIPCEPRRGELQSIDDLRTIRGFTDAVLGQLRPFITAFPAKKGDQGINVRTAPPEVLRAIGCENTDALSAPPRTSDDVRAWLEEENCPSGTKPKPKNLDRSKVYSIISTAIVGDATQSVEAIVEVKSKAPLSWKQRPVWGVGPGGVP